MAIGDIPKGVLNDIMLELKHYLVAIYVLMPERPQPLRPIGSGTLVKIEGSHHILTAAHVWHETRGAKEIGLVLTDHQSRFTIPRDFISAKQLWNGLVSEWGPDMALLRLPPSCIPTIEARKSFLNLVQQRESFASCPPAIEKGLWAVTGMVGEFTEVQSHPEAGTVECHIRGEAFISAVQQTHERDGYDYFDLGADLSLLGVPSSFGGVSGGGLWDVRLSMAKSGTISWDGKRYFRGVAFWETEKSGNHRMIRCHGLKSVFDKAWESWALPRG